MTETFGQRLVFRRRSTVVPATTDRPEHAMTQEELAAAILTSLSAVRHYERDRRLPHPIVRREILRLWPDFFQVTVTLQ